MVGRAWAVCFLASLSVAACADDIVFSSGRLAKRGGVYYRSGPAHLYRCRADGTRRRPLTAGSMDDTDPCLTPDGTRILFWRRDREDLVGRAWLCSIRPDGKDLRIHKRVRDAEPGSPRAAFKPPADVSLPGIRSKQGGTAVPVSISELQDGTYLFGYYEETSQLGMADRKGKPIRRLRTFKVVEGKRFGAALFHNTQWHDNGEGARAFWFGPDRRRILLQKVVRDQSGGQPHLFFVDARSGQVKRPIADGFLQDVDSGRTDFLTIRWAWGDPSGPDDGVARRTLAVWRSGRAAQTIGPRDAACYGACFVRASWPLPARANATLGVPPLGAKRSRGEIVFAATRYDEHLGNVYEAEPSRLYRMRFDGTGLRRLTRSDGYDVQPSLTKDGRRILFWRSKSQWQGPFRLHSVSLDGKDLRRLRPAVDAYPTAHLAQAMLAAKPGTIVRGEVDYDGHATIRDPRGRVIASDKQALFSPNGRKAIVRGEGRSAVVDLATGRTTPLASRWKTPAWIDDRTIIALRGELAKEEDRSMPGEIAYLNLSGGIVRRKPVTLPLYVDGMWPDTPGAAGLAVRLGNRETFLWEAHHWMSDGGYNFLHRVDMRRGKPRSLGEGTLEAVSPDGHLFVSTQYDWVGGYKGAGAAKLGTMLLWDAETLNRRPFGFRRMICGGACFVTGQ